MANPIFFGAINETKKLAHQSAAMCQKASVLLDDIKSSGAYTKTQEFFSLVDKAGGLNAFLAHLKMDEQQHKIFRHEVQSLRRTLHSQESNLQDSSKALKKPKAAPKKRLHL